MARASVAEVVTWPSHNGNGMHFTAASSRARLRSACITFVQSEVEMVHVPFDMKAQVKGMFAR